MKKVHVVIPDLFLPSTIAKEVSKDLNVPTLEKFLARSISKPLKQHSLEAWLCETFDVPNGAIAPVTMQADGLQPADGYWLRADPVHLNLDHSQVILQTNVSPSRDEARQLCEHLNQHFLNSGMTFFAPHPQRWYLRLAHDPYITTHSLSQVEGRNSRDYMPQGEHALRWHGILNEIQMLLHFHPLGQVMEDRGALPINSLWFWGGGHSVTARCAFAQVCNANELAGAFALASETPVNRFGNEYPTGNTLLVLDGLSRAVRRGDYYAWRESLRQLELDYLTPLLKSLQARDIQQVSLEVLQEEGSFHYEVNSTSLWKWWKRVYPLAHYAVV